MGEAFGEHFSLCLCYPVLRYTASRTPQGMALPGPTRSKPANLQLGRTCVLMMLASRAWLPTARRQVQQLPCRAVAGSCAGWPSIAVSCVGIQEAPQACPWTQPLSTVTSPHEELVWYRVVSASP